MGVFRDHEGLLPCAFDLQKILKSLLLHTPTIDLSPCKFPNSNFPTMVPSAPSLAVFSAMSLALLYRAYKRKPVVCTVVQVNVYPIKSCQGITVASAELTESGLKNDRRFMLVDATTHSFLSQRQLPRMALISTRMDAHAVTACLPSQEEVVLGLFVCLHEIDGQKQEKRYNVRVWEDIVEDALDMGDAVAQQFSNFLEREVRCVRMDASSGKRVVDKSYTKTATPKDQLTLFSDGYPLLLTSTSSLEELNKRTRLSTSMKRYRPNIVVSGLLPFQEDALLTFYAENQVVFTNVKPCSRCKITTINPDKGQVDAPDLLTKMKEFRTGGYLQKKAKVYFGVNLVQDTSRCAEPKVQVGMELEARFR